MMSPFDSIDGDLVKVDLYTSDNALLLKSDKGRMELPLPVDGVYESDNPYDFFTRLIDPASIKRVELVPYGEDASCNVVTSTGDRVAGNSEFCAVIALELDVPVMVHKTLLRKSEISGDIVLKETR